MKTFNKVIRGKDIKMKFFVNDTTSELEKKVNEWLSGKDIEIVSIDFNSADSCIRCFIMYRE